MRIASYSARRRLLAAAALGCALCGACTDDTAGAWPGGIQGAFGVQPDPGPGKARWLAVVGGDYKSSALSIIDLASLQDDDVQSAPAQHSAVLHSGSQFSASAMALSGDVVLAQATLPDRHVLLVDRGSGALTELEPKSGAVVRQVSVATGFYANPQDVALLADGRWLVSRMGKNPSPTADLTDFDEGDDLLVVQPTTGQIVSRLGLSAFRATPDSRVAPQRMARQGDKIWLTLAEFSSDLKAQGTAILAAVLDGPYPGVAGWPLAPWRNCVNTQALPGQRLLVSCQGSFQMAAQQVEQSALLVIDTAGNEPTVVLAVPAQAAWGPWSRDVAAIDARWFAATSLGDFAAQRPDRLWLIDSTTGQRTRLADAAKPFGYSGLWADPVRRTVWVAEADRQGADLLRILLGVGGEVVAGKAVASNPGGLGALELKGL